MSCIYLNKINIAIDFKEMSIKSIFIFVFVVLHVVFTDALRDNKTYDNMSLPHFIDEPFSNSTFLPVIEHSKFCFFFDTSSKTTFNSTVCLNIGECSLFPNKTRIQEHFIQILREFMLIENNTVDVFPICKDADFIMEDNFTLNDNYTSSILCNSTGYSGLTFIFYSKLWPSFYRNCSSNQNMSNCQYGINIDCFHETDTKSLMNQTCRDVTVNNTVAMISKFYCTLDVCFNRNNSLPEQLNILNLSYQIKLSTLEYCCDMHFCSNSNNLTSSQASNDSNDVRNFYEEIWLCTCFQEDWLENKSDNMCPVNCRNDSCNNETSSCYACRPGWHGDKCDQKCLKNCGTCIDNTTCIRCMDGYNGKQCELNCSIGCKSCTADGKLCFSCTTKNDFGSLYQCKVNECQNYSDSSNCTYCKKEGWYISGEGCCPCSQNCIGGNMMCDNTTGSCIKGCKKGYYGDKCVDKCSENCAGNNTLCNSTTGECMYGCDEGFYLPDCSYDCSLFYPYCSKCSNISDDYYLTAKCISCIDGYYMPSKYRLTNHTQPYLSDFCFPCEHCLHSKCDGTTGLCLEGCKDFGQYNSEAYINGEIHCVLKCKTCHNLKCNFTNGLCLDGCVQGYYGPMCDAECSDSCKNSTCHVSSGQCNMCERGYYGQMCNLTCGQCKSGMCHQITGECEGGCSHGYFEQTCKKHCNNCIGHDCDINGVCLHGCVPRRHGNTCNETCPNNCFICHPDTGHCIISNSSDSDFNFFWNVSKYSCEIGWYGIHCNTPCGTGCREPDQSKMNCDRFTGYCPECIKGYHGIGCSVECNKTCKDHECSKDGTCRKPCDFRWQGKYCQTYFPETMFEKLSGILFALMAVIVFTINVVCIYFKRRKEQMEKVDMRRKSGIHFKRDKHDTNTYV